MINLRFALFTATAKAFHGICIFLSRFLFEVSSSSISIDLLSIYLAARKTVAHVDQITTPNRVTTIRHHEKFRNSNKANQNFLLTQLSKQLSLFYKNSPIPFFLPCFSCSSFLDQPAYSTDFCARINNHQNKTMDSEDIITSPSVAMVSRESQTDYNMKPKKSILKLRDGNTMPLISLNDTNGHTPSKIINRRVSFAQNVELHQIELVRSQESDWHVSELASSDFSSDDDPSFLRLEADAETLAQSLGHQVVPQLSSDEENELNADDQTMELTGQIKDLDDLFEEQTMELTGELQIPQIEPKVEVVEKVEIVQSVKKENGEGIEEKGEDADVADGGIDEMLDLGEADMEFTEFNGVKSSAGTETENKPKSNGLTEITSSLELSKGEVSVSKSNPLPNKELPKSSSPIQIPVLQPLTSDDELDEDVSMELTQQVDGNPENDGELEMELTQQVTKPDENDEVEKRASSNGTTNPENVEFAQPEKGDTSGLAPLDAPNGDQESQAGLSNGNIESQGDVTNQEESTMQEEVTMQEETAIQISTQEEIVTQEVETTDVHQEQVTTPENDTNSPENQQMALDVQVTPQNTHKRFSTNGSTQLPKRFHSVGYVTSTTTVPLADVSMTSMEDDDEEFTPVSLTDFLTEIGIKFFDDLDFSTDKSNKYRLSLSEASETVSSEDYYRANVQTPLLEVYELCCTELSGKIEQGKKLFEELKKETLQNNPDVFRQYFRSSSYDRMNMVSRFNQLMKFSREQGKQIWYQWRSKLIDSLLDVLKGNLEMMHNDKAVLLENLELLDGLHKEIQNQYQSIRSEVAQFKDIQRRFGNLDADQIRSIRLKLTNLNQRLLDHKEEIQVKEDQLMKLQENIARREEVIAELQKEISTSDQKLAQLKPFNSSDLGHLETRAQILQAGAGLKYVQNTDANKYEFQFNLKINVTVDFSRADEPNGITLLPLENTQGDVLHNENFLLRYCQQLVEQTSFTNIYESFISFRQQWLKIEEIDRDIQQLQVRFPIKFAQEVSDRIAFTFTYYSFESKEKAQCKVEIPLESITRYPKNVRVSFVDKFPKSAKSSFRISQILKFHMFSIAEMS